jgi:UDP-N-acetylmuramyl pentapeptide phosphotransferase/UDP-N-acetylglucosamine-1-phosphate transferase
MLASHMPHLMLSALLSLAICSQARWIGERLGVMDIPDPVGGRKRHEKATPLVGGTARCWLIFRHASFSRMCC